MLFVAFSTDPGLKLALEVYGSSSMCAMMNDEQFGNPDIPVCLEHQCFRVKDKDGNDAGLRLRFTVRGRCMGKQWESHSFGNTQTMHIKNNFSRAEGTLKVVKLKTGRLCAFVRFSFYKMGIFLQPQEKIALAGECFFLIAGALLWQQQKSFFYCWV